MSASQFTPGPWKVEADSLGKGGPWDRIAISSPVDTVVANVNKMISAAMPNAYLLAAAPELYKALRLLKDRRCADFTLDEWEQIDAALDAAIGRP
jgi:hypothetical protein